MNLFQKFRRLLPRDPLQVGTVTAHNADGTSTLTLPAGGTVRVQGQDVAIGARAFFQSGRITGEAPDLTPIEITV